MKQEPSYDASYRSGSSTRVRSNIVASRLLIVVLTCSLLYWGRVVLVPLALAILISFAFAPLVKALQSTKLPRTVAVAVVVSLLAGLVLALGWFVGSQLTELAQQLPSYRQNIVEKVRDVRNSMSGGAIEDIKKTLEEVDREVNEQEEIDREVTTSKSEKELPDVLIVDVEPTAPVMAELPADSSESIAHDSPVAVKVIPENNLLGIDSADKLFPVLNPVATAGLVLILTIFILIKREDLADRLVSFASPTQVLPTVRALNEAGVRISRFLLTQLCINICYGVAVGLGLYLLDVQYPIVWGLCAGVFRYVPYIGPWVAALLPLTVSTITSSGWNVTFGVIALFLVLELISNNIVEPLFYGKSVGISEVAVLISAVIWAWLWGPVGLVLATPLSVCLVVLGQHVPGLNFFTRLMVDDRVVEPSVQLYQRLMGRDESAAITFASEHIKENGWHQSVDDILLPMLVAAKADQKKGRLTEIEVEAVTDFIDDLIGQHCATVQDGDDQFNHTILVCPPQGKIDGAALELAEHTLEADHRNCDLINLGSNLLASEVAEKIRDSKPVAVVVANLPPQDLTYARRWCRMVKRSTPEAFIIVAQWCGDNGTISDEAAKILREAGADAAVTTPDKLWGQIAPRLTLDSAKPEGDWTA